MGVANALCWCAGQGVAQLDKVTFASFGATSVNYDYVSAATYGPLGATQVQLNNGLFEVRAFNNRGQLCRLALLSAGATAGCPETSGTPANNMLDLAYTYMSVLQERSSEFCKP